MGFVASKTNPANPTKTELFNVLMNPATLGKLGSSTQLTWISWVLKANEPSSMSFVALVINPVDPAKTWLFICFNELLS